MKGILIKIKDGHILDGDGEFLGKDNEGNPYTFWRSNGHMEVPADLAIALEREKPQRYEMVNRALADKIVGIVPPEIKKEEPKLNINSILNQVEKAIELNKSEQIALLKKLKIIPDKKGKEFDRVRKIILSGHKL